MSGTVNPLRYPGGKKSLVNYISNLVLANNLKGSRFYEPYAGSAVVGIELLRKNTISDLVLCEKDILIFAFWECVFKHNKELCEKIEQTPITIATWQNLAHYRSVNTLCGAPLLELGFAGLFFNRTNFSGILKANPIGGINQTSKYPIDCRFNKQRLINIIEHLGEYKSSVSVHFEDALVFMKKQQKNFVKKSCFAYLDPPYYKKGVQIYRHFYKDQDHINLYNYVNTVNNLDWIVSYDDEPFICDLYNDQKIKSRMFFTYYSCAAGKVRSKGQELFISNLPLPPFSMARKEFTYPSFI